jgi:RNA polymerase sigma-70 factor (ECF subfamily)
LNFLLKYSINIYRTVRWGEGVVSEEIISEAMNRNSDAFRIIFSEYSQKIYKTAYLIIKDYQYAEDAVQEIFLQVHLNIHKLKDIGSFEAWLYKITLNVCYSKIKKIKRLNLLFLEDGIEEFMDKEEADFDIPDEIILRKELQSLIMECVYTLPIKHRTVLTLYYFNDFSIKQIAEIAEANDGTIKSRLFYGKKLLKEKLLQKGKIVELLAGGVDYESR